MADLHRAGRYDRMSDDVLTLTGQGPLSVQEFVRKNGATFTASAMSSKAGQGKAPNPGRGQKAADAGSTPLSSPLPARDKRGKA